MSCPVLNRDLPGCHDDTPDEGLAPLALPPLPEGHPLRRADLAELALDIDCDVEHLRDVVEGRAYLRRELVDITAAALKAQGIKVQASDLDPLGRVYTPEWTADAMAKIVRESRWGAELTHVLDPGCGGGALLAAARRVLPEARLVGFDLDPLAKGLDVANVGHVKSALTIEPGMYGTAEGDIGDGLAVLMNPPYDDAGIAILRHVLEVLTPDIVVALVPLSWCCTQELADLVHGDNPATIVPVVGRPWGRLREAVVLVWGRVIDAPRVIRRPDGVRAEP